MESEIRSTQRKICAVLVCYDHEIVLEGLKQPTVVCAIVLFITAHCGVRHCSVYNSPLWCVPLFCL
jgi:hypothetical protein